MVETCRQRVHLYPPNSRTRGSISSPAGCGWWAGAGPGAGGGAELLTAGQGLITVAATQQEIVLGVLPPPHHQRGQLARGGGGGEEHLRGVVSVQATGYQDG